MYGSIRTHGRHSSCWSSICIGLVVVTTGCGVAEAWTRQSAMMGGLVWVAGGFGVLTVNAAWTSCSKFIPTFSTGQNDANTALSCVASLMAMVVSMGVTGILDDVYSGVNTSRDVKAPLLRINDHNHTISNWRKFNQLVADDTFNTMTFQEFLMPQGEGHSPKCMYSSAGGECCEHQ
uniref:ARAD1B00154p n=1 Tax=Blastobotrys adeninivorans TaxID=409370 RepID=A0A060TAG9_BLAAD